MKYKLNFTDLKRQYDTMADEINQTIQEVLNSTRFIGGPKIEELEKQLSAYCQSKYAIGVASGTDALLLSLMAMDIQPGDEVITSPFTFIATAEVIALLKAKPVFVDIDEQTYNMDIQQIQDKLTDKTKAIIPVHLYGQIAEMDEIINISKKHNLTIIEDACQAVGAEYKNRKACSIGDFAALSFFPSKNLGCYGDGGMVITNNEAMAMKLKMLREHGQKARYEHEYIGITGRLDAIQAAVLIVKLKYLDNWIDKRIKLAARYTENLNQYVQTPITRPYNKHVFNQYTICTEQRDQLISFLDENGIPAAVHYPKALHMQNTFTYLGYEQGDFPVSENIAKKVCSLPMFPEMTESEQDLVIETIQKFFK